MASICHKKLHPYPHRALLDTLLLSFQSLERAAALLTACVTGQAARAPWRGWAVPKLWRAQQGGRPQLRSHLQLSGSSGAAPAGSGAVLDQGLLLHVTPRGNEPARAAEPTLLWCCTDSTHCRVVVGSSCRLGISISPGKPGNANKAMPCPTGEPCRTLCLLPVL